MRARQLQVLVLAIIAGSAGCYSLPKQTGTWDGETEKRTLYDARQRECTCVALVITVGPALKKYVPQGVIMVKQNLQTYTADEVIGTKLRVRGRIASEFPVCASTGKMLIGYRPDSTGDMPGIYVIKVSKLEYVQ